MFDQSFFDDLLKTVAEVNKTWKEFAGENLVNLARTNIITRDGATYFVRYNLGRLSENEDNLYVVTYDVETDESRLVCIPFCGIERVEVFEGKSGTAGKTAGFETATVKQL